jgi:hypothetical protein
LLSTLQPNPFRVLRLTRAENHGVDENLGLRAAVPLVVDAQCVRELVK